MRSNIFWILVIALFAGNADARAQASQKKQQQSGSTETVFLKESPEGNRTIVEVKEGKIYVNGELITDAASANGQMSKKIIIEHDEEQPTGTGGNYYNSSSNRAMLGVFTATDERQEGAVVQSVSPRSAAEDAGLMVGDRITDVAGKAIRNAKDLSEVISSYQPGDKVDIRYEREGAQLQTRAELDRARPMSRFGRPPARPIFPPIEIDPDGRYGMWLDEQLSFLSGGPKLGITGQDMPDEGGVKVLEVKPESPAASAGLKANDVITKIGRKNIYNLTDLVNGLRKFSEGEKASLEYERNGKTHTVDVAFPARLREREL